MSPGRQFQVSPDNCILAYSDAEDRGHPHHQFRADNAYVLTEAAAAGLGVVAMGEMIAGPYVEAGKLVPVMTRFSLPDVGIHVVRPPSRHIPRKVRILIDLLVEKFSGKQA